LFLKKPVEWTILSSSSGLARQSFCGFVALEKGGVTEFTVCLLGRQDCRNQQLQGFAKFNAHFASIGFQSRDCSAKKLISYSPVSDPGGLPGFL
jgi:hypothetical protein